MWMRYEEEDWKGYERDWKRYFEDIEAGKLFPARFGTLWQARKACACDCKLLARMQAEKRRA